MQFMMFVCSDSEPDAMAEAKGEVQAWVDELESRGKRITGDLLRPVGDARTVRVRGGRRQVTDGRLQRPRK